MKSKEQGLCRIVNFLDRRPARTGFVREPNGYAVNGWPPAPLNRVTGSVRRSAAGTGRERKMLILTRRAEERILIGDDVVVSVLEIEGRRVKLGIHAPTKVSILREEIAARDTAPAENDERHGLETARTGG